MLDRLADDLDTAMPPEIFEVIAVERTRLWRLTHDGEAADRIFAVTWMGATHADPLYAEMAEPLTQLTETTGTDPPHRLPQAWPILDRLRPALRADPLPSRPRFRTPPLARAPAQRR